MKLWAKVFNGTNSEAWEQYINQAVIFIHPTLVFQSRKLFLFCFYKKIGLHLIECIMKITAVFKHMAKAVRHGRITLFSWLSNKFYT